MSTANYTLPIVNTVTNFTSKDFALDSVAPNYIRYGDCILLLFYNQTDEGLGALSIFIETSKDAIGPKFASCHLGLPTNREIVEKMATLPESDPFKITSVPMIVTYRGGRPYGNYNGDIAVQPLVDFASTLACSVSYYEPENQRFGTSTTSTNSEVIKTAMKSSQAFTTSSRFTVNRGDYSNLGVTTSDQVEPVVPDATATSDTLAEIPA